MTASIIKFPLRGPFVVRFERQEQIWLVTCRDHSWAHTCYHDALAEARELGRQFAVNVMVTP